MRFGLLFSCSGEVPTVFFGLMWVKLKSPEVVWQEVCTPLWIGKVRRKSEGCIRCAQQYIAVAAASSESCAKTLPHREPKSHGERTGTAPARGGSLVLGSMDQFPILQLAVFCFVQFETTKKEGMPSRIGEKKKKNARSEFVALFAVGRTKMFLQFKALNQFLSPQDSVFSIRKEPMSAMFERPVPFAWG